MDRIDRPPAGPIPTPTEFLAAHPPLTDWGSAAFDEYDTVLVAAARNATACPNCHQLLTRAHTCPDRAAS